MQGASDCCQGPCLESMADGFGPGVRITFRSRWSIYYILFVLGKSFRARRGWNDRLRWLWRNKLVAVGLQMALDFAGQRQLPRRTREVYSPLSGVDGVGEL